jgi:integrase/recombinase XerD
MSNGLKSLFDLFIKEKRFLENRSEETIKSYELVFWRYGKYSDATTLPTNELLSRFVMGMREGGLAATTCNISIRSFNSFLSWLHANGHIANLRLKKIKEPERVRKTLSDEKVKAVLNWKPETRAEHRLYALICVLADTGVRIKEAMTITNEGVDYDNLLITVIGKGNKQRIVPMSLELRKVLHRYSQKHKYSRFPTELFFCSSTGTRLSYHNTYRDLGRVFKKCGITHADFDGYFHMWRRKFAKGYVRNGGNLFYLQKTLGHTNIATTKIYVDVEPEDLKAVHLKTSPLSRLK